MVTQQNDTHVRPSRLEKSTPNDVIEVASNMRQEDIEEIYAYSGADPKSSLIYCYFGSQPCMTMVGRKGNIMGMYGVIPVRKNMGKIWMLGHRTMTTDYKDVRAFLRNSPIELDKFKMNFPILFNYVDARNTTHVKWIKYMGFSIIKEHATFGYEGRPFYEFAKV
ncbi:MAG TPA: hypothetical protein DCM40_43315 [Maribacter sp.]|nr:hypothetical protein [Maribacter sp.]